MIHPAQEQDVVPGRKLLVSGGALIAAIILCVLVAYGIGRCASYDWSAARRTPAVPMPNEVNAMETSVIRSEAQGLETNQRAEEYLHTFGWVDPKQQIVHIPIEVAFQLYLERQVKPAPQQPAPPPQQGQGQPPRIQQPQPGAGRQRVVPQGAPQQGAPQQGGRQQGASQQGASQQGASQQGASKQGAQPQGTQAPPQGGPP